MTRGRAWKNRVRTSDLGVWDYDHARGTARWVFRYDPAHVTVLDKGPARYGGGALDIRRGTSKVMARIEQGVGGAYLVTRGANGKGGTRHRFYNSLELAQDAALAWLDRRFAVEVKV